MQALERTAAVHVGDRIQAARKHSGFTLAVLAGKAGIHANTLSNIERGKSNATDETIKRISAALARPLDEIIGPPPVQAPESGAVVAFLEEFRAEGPEIFDQWSTQMWTRYLGLGQRFAIANREAAIYFATQVTREFQCIEQLFDLFDANQADEVVALVSSRHAKLNQGTPSHEYRLDSAHPSMPSRRARALSAIG